MLFLADEDFPGIAVRWLREAGHDVVWARTHMPGDADSALLAAAQRDIRVVLTCDKDFGEAEASFTGSRLRVYRDALPAAWALSRLGRSLVMPV